MLNKIIKNNLFFFLPYLAVIIALIPVLLLNSKPDIHLMINGHHNPFFDVFFRYATYLGDGLFIIVPVIILLFISVRHAAFILSAYLASGFITQLLKRVFFHDVIRPSRFFTGVDELHLVEGVKMLGSRSFPSGHTTSAFAIFLGLALIIRNKYLKLACFIAACVVGFSRIYLSQHFLIDTYVGSMIGCIGAVGLYTVFYHKNGNWHTWKIQNLFKKNDAQDK